jgi:hypothetical protein
VLAALYFVPSASASASPAVGQDHVVAAAAAAGRSAAAPAAAHRHLDLADTGAVDTKPYVVGGSVLLVAGAGLVLGAGRRARQQEQTA